MRVRILLRELFLYWCTILALVTTGCGSHSNGSHPSEVVFSYQQALTAGAADAEVVAGLFETTASSILVSIEDATGVLVYSDTNVPLHGLRGSQVSEPLGLSPGHYRLTSFAVLDANGQVLYIAPKANSTFGYLVKRPLPLEFDVASDVVQKVTPEVVTPQGAAESYGYITGGFELVETTDFYISVTAAQGENMTGIASRLVVTNAADPSESEPLYNGSLPPGTQRVRVRKVGGYLLQIQAEGYVSKAIPLTSDTLAAYQTSPLVVVLNAGKAEIVLTFPATPTNTSNATTPLGLDTVPTPQAGGSLASSLQQQASRSARPGSSTLLSQLAGVGFPQKPKAFLPAVAKNYAGPLEGTAATERRFVVVTLINSEGQYAYYRAPFELAYDAVNHQWSGRIELATTGDFTITELFITNESMETIEAVPVKDSFLAQHFADTILPVPIAVSATEEQPSVPLHPTTKQITPTQPLSSFGYDAPVDFALRTITLKPFYQDPTTAHTYCIGRIALALTVCKGTAEHCSSDESFQDPCVLYTAFRGTKIYEKMCPRLTPALATAGRTEERQEKDCGATVALPTISVPWGYDHYRLVARKRQHATFTQNISAANIAKWDISKTLPLEMPKTVMAAFALANQDSASTSTTPLPLLYDAEGYCGEPRPYDVALSEYPVTLQPNVVDYNEVLYGQRATKTIVVKNNGDNTLELTNIKITNSDPATVENPGFNLLMAASSTLASGQESQIVVAFLRNSADAGVDEVDQTAVLEIQHNDPHVGAIAGSTARITLKVRAVSEFPARCNDGNQCTTDYYVANSGCKNDRLPVGSTCTDGNACTENDQCNDSGLCVSGTAKTCNDGNTCTEDRCEPSRGCVFETKADGTGCDDGDPCTTDVCRGSQCLSQGKVLKAKVRFDPSTSAYVHANYCMGWHYDYNNNRTNESILTEELTLLQYDAASADLISTPQSIPVSFTYGSGYVDGTIPRSCNWWESPDPGHGHCHDGACPLNGTSIEGYGLPEPNVLEGGSNVSVTPVGGYSIQEVDTNYAWRVTTNFIIEAKSVSTAFCASTSTSD